MVALFQGRGNQEVSQIIKMTLKDSALALLPPEFASINWRDIWERPLADGTAFQWSVVGALANALAKHGWSYSLPLLDVDRGQELMTLRNEIPLAHLSRAGHSATSWEETALEDRFLQSLIPKIVFEKEGKSVSLFIEGCPYHLIATGVRYEIRPDILLLPGRIESISYDPSDKVVRYKYRYSQELLLEGILRVGSSRLLPIVQRSPAEDIPLEVIGVIECSVNKSARVASAQIEGYKAVFNFEDEEGTVLVVGNEIKADCGPMAQVNLSTTDQQELETSLKQAGEYIRTHLLEPLSDSK